MPAWRPRHINIALRERRILSTCLFEEAWCRMGTRAAL